MTLSLFESLKFYCIVHDYTWCVHMAEVELAIKFNFVKIEYNVVLHTCN